MVRENEAGHSQGEAGQHKGASSKLGAYLYRHAFTWVGGD